MTTTTTTKPATVCTVGPDEIRPCAACRKAPASKRSHGCNVALEVAESRGRKFAQSLLRADRREGCVGRTRAQFEGMLKVQDPRQVGDEGIRAYWAAAFAIVLS